MKQGKRPTRKQKELMSAYKLHPDNWLVLSDTPQELLLLNRVKGTTRTVRKGA
ncbi:hypothetical protein DFQ01_103195 [Paenibacillus cellulosilyticus]|uniref:DUF6906 domain-containing protein n=1 Tax=Paenibacillus cellulosilyticus TaxID=375489 RepID=A0A2V2YXC7_9BACL|nr:hypothetical protein [Paenibacillus cellulosilyticus]PWW06293.1 hypothetical protein DFQ01_103195 [Paenibacillus cellulosilyticus]QKS42960.1 hypothetical protein HUB94_00220 [Paenibacillus cellulosilyticus]QKS43483.1 hypothetical protein HUB94_02885 [Paenibacillus cellulosilyticus]